MMHDNEGGLVFSGDEVNAVYEIAKSAKTEATSKSFVAKTRQLAKTALYARRGHRDSLSKPTSITISPEDQHWFAAAAQMYGERQGKRIKIPLSLIDQIIKMIQRKDN